jgi:hypothetical protein
MAVCGCRCGMSTDPIMKRSVLGPPVLICALILMIFSSLAHAQEAQLDNIIVTNTRDDLLLYLTAKDAFSPKIEAAIHSGVPTTFGFYINLYRTRGLWLDQQIVEIKLTHTVKYDTLKKAYVVTRSWEGDRPLTTTSLDEAKKAMAEVDSLVIVPLNRLEKGEQYQIRVKAELSKKTLPFYLHYVLFFVSLWDVETDWYTIDFIY